MLKILAGVAIVLAIAIAVVLALAATKPDTFQVTRSATINAPAAKIFPLIADFHQWGQWSPWEKKDPGMQRSFSGANSGLGAIYAWNGNSQVGSGRMEIIEATAPGKLAIKLDFIKPLEGHNVAEFTMLPQGNATLVTWTMHGPTPLLGKIIHVFMDMDRMVGNDFAAGLAAIKSITEK